MTEGRYAELELYHAICRGAAYTERKFQWGYNNEDRKREWFSALDKIRKYLDPNNSRHKSLQISPYSLVENEEDALKLINFAEMHFEMSQGLIVPRDEMHGALRFFRRLRLPGFFENQSEDLVNRLKKSGHSPNSLKVRMAKSNRRMFGESNIDYVNIAEQEAWRDALKFY